MCSFLYFLLTKNERKKRKEESSYILINFKIFGTKSLLIILEEGKKKKGLDLFKLR